MALAKGIRMIWFEKEVVNAAKVILRKTSKELAESIMADAIKRLRQKAVTRSERGLLTQFDLMLSPMDGETYLVWCQGPRNWIPPYHASFVEMGTWAAKPKPYLNPARKAHIGVAKKKYKEVLK